MQRNGHRRLSRTAWSSTGQPVSSLAHRKGHVGVVEDLESGRHVERGCCLARSYRDARGSGLSLGRDPVGRFSGQMEQRVSSPGDLVFVSVLGSRGHPHHMSSSGRHGGGHDRGCA